MHLLHQHAIRYEFTERNAINKSSAKRKRLSTPTRLDVDQLRRLLNMWVACRQRHQAKRSRWMTR